MKNRRQSDGVLVGKQPRWYTALLSPLPVHFLRSQIPFWTCLTRVEYPIPFHRVRAVKPCRRTKFRLQLFPKDLKFAFETGNGFHPKDLRVTFEIGCGFHPEKITRVIESTEISVELTDRSVEVQEHIVELLNCSKHDFEP